VKLDEVSKILGLTGKPEGIDGSRVEEMVRAGQIEEVARYCESDVLNTYRVWLIYELFRGAITAEQLAWSEGQIREFVANRKTSNSHLEAAVGIVDQSHELSGPCEVRPIPSETREMSLKIPGRGICVKKPDRRKGIVGPDFPEDARNSIERPSLLPKLQAVSDKPENECRVTQNR
jgi:Predicted 3'-5' exonuclease related to the exonuclease domain of PolB